MCRDIPDRTRCVVTLARFLVTHYQSTDLARITTRQIRHLPSRQATQDVCPVAVSRCRDYSPGGEFRSSVVIRSCCSRLIRRSVSLTTLRSVTKYHHWGSGGGCSSGRTLRITRSYTTQRETDPARLSSSLTEQESACTRQSSVNHPEKKQALGVYPEYARIATNEKFGFGWHPQGEAKWWTGFEPRLSVHTRVDPWREQAQETKEDNSCKQEQFRCPSRHGRKINQATLSCQRRIDSSYPKLRAAYGGQWPQGMAPSAVSRSESTTGNGLRNRWRAHLCRGVLPGRT
jgi:hypothetical protein